METNEQTALLKYLEFCLVAMIEEVEPHIEHAVTNKLYEIAYNTVRDIEDGMSVSKKLVVKPTSSP